MIQPTNAIQTLRLSKRLGNRTVLREVDLGIAAGQCVALMGSNGSGKTTLLRCLAGITRPDSGQVRWFGRPAAESPNDRRLVGMVTHESRLYAHLSMRENLVFAARMCAVDEPARSADTLLKQMGLQALADRQVRKISRGTQQRLALGRALIHDPPILLFDEPFSGLDLIGRDWLSRYLKEQTENGRAICFVTHDLELARQLADRTLILVNGILAEQRIVAFDTTDTIRHAA